MNVRRFSSLETGAVKGLFGLLLAAIAMPVVAAGAFVLALVGLKRVGLDRPEITLPILLVGGVLTVVLVLVIAVLLLSQCGLTDKSEALGLPPGSIRAVIALLLILIFGVTGLFLFGSYDGGETTTANLTEAQVAQIPVEQIVSQELSTQRLPSGARLIRVERNLPLGEGAREFATQLFTAVSTLVSAIAAFYFGTKAVARTTSVATPLSPTIRKPDEGSTTRSPVDISGSAQPKASVAVRDKQANDKELGTTKADSMGDWSMQLELKPGPQVIHVVATTEAGTSPPSSPRTFTVTPPAPPD